ncbi:hypothetical protein CVT24_002980 [Panaeolus cyanescens]|uniref:F-box domain-containing protein n=1 Tax=Panaeolus cyanescens TaxID=181874 RepID=A0A409VTZ6_9AGAR|nr:hypothetical protein CVT24_002980 [Panaeolus cyanescens]
MLRCSLRILFCYSSLLHPSIYLAPLYIDLPIPHHPPASRSPILTLIPSHLLSPVSSTTSTAMITPSYFEMEDSARTMHPIFQCPSIIQEIFRLVESRRDVVQVALTCRFFHQHALDVIWELLDYGILPLFQLLPNLGCREEKHDNLNAGSYRYRGKERTTKTYFLKDTVTPADIEKLKSFGRRVWSISCARRKKTDLIDASTYIAVLSALQGHLLFPNLRSVHWDLYSRESSGIFYLFHSPRLTKVELHCSNVQTINPSWIHDISMFIHHLGREKIQLSHLTIDIPCTQALADLVMSAFPSVARLALDLESNTIIGYSHLSSMPNLHLLEECHLEGESLQFAFGQDTPQLTFSSLTLFSLTCKFDQALKLLSNSTFPALVHFFHSFWVPSGSVVRVISLDWVAFFTALRKATTSTFNDIYLEPWRQTRTQREGIYSSFLRNYSGVAFDTIFPCLSQFDLEGFNVDFPFFRSLTQDNLKTIMQRWPRMVSLSLHTHAREKFHLSTLKDIAETLPRLHFLRLDIDPTDSESWEATLSSFFAIPPLLELYLRFPAHVTESSAGGSGLGLGLTRLGQVAGFVDTLFPLLHRFDEIDFGRGDVCDFDDYEEPLGRLMTLLSQCKMARRMERQRYDVGEVVKVEEEVVEEEDDVIYQLYNRSPSPMVERIESVLI